MAKTTADDTWFFGHPRGLMQLYFTEMWERFSYYGMRAILVLYLAREVTDGGWGLTNTEAGTIYGVYAGLVYLLSLPGGWIADRFLGQQNAVLYGGVLIFFGHVCLALPAQNMFFVGLGLIVLGTGLLKPNVSTIVGQLYTPEDTRRDAGFAIYYMGVNLGGWLGSLIVPFLADSKPVIKFLAGYGLDRHDVWHVGFGAAAVGMFFGVIQFALGRKTFGDAGKFPVPNESPEEARKNRGILIAVIAFCLGTPALVAALHFSGTFVLDDTRVTIGMIALLSLVSIGLFTFMFTVGKWTADERKRLVGIVFLFVGCAVFFAVFEQAGSTFNLFAQQQTDNHVFGWEFPAGIFQQFNSLFVILLSPVMAMVWTFLQRRGKEPAFPIKFGLSLLFVAGGCLVMLPGAFAVEAGGKSAPVFLILLYLMHTVGELLLSPVGLSVTTKLAPRRVAGLAMGIWFTALGIGNYCSGYMARLTEQMTFTKMFVVLAIIPTAVGLLFLALNGPMKRLLGRNY